MYKYLLNVLVVGCLFAVSGCQTNPVNSIFSPTFSEVGVEQSVRDALMRSEDPVIANVHVTTNQNVVILSGYVKKIRQSDVAEQIAREVPGVQMVENHLIVRQ